MTAYNGLHNKEDMIGLRFNKWTVLEYSHKHERSGNWYYLCRCDCGNTGTVKGANLRNNGSKQCKQCSGKVNGRKGIYAQNKDNDLYVINCLDLNNNDLYKIGTTSNLEERLRTMSSGNPFELEVTFYAKGKGHMEEYFHNMFKHLHWKGEWYCLGIDELGDIRSELLKGGCEI